MSDEKPNVTPATIENGLADAIFPFPQSTGLGGGFNPFGFPANQGAPWSPTISQPTTLFKDLRWFFVSNDRQLLCEAYVEIGLVQTIVDVPVDDGLRGGVTIKSKQLNEDQIEELKISLDRDDDLTVAGMAAKWNRLFGGSGILVLTDQDPATPLDLKRIGPDTPLEFRAADLWELFWDKQNNEGYDPAIQTQNFTHYNYYGEQVHKSRVMRLKGQTAPSFLRPRLRGWGFSVVEALIRSVNQYLKATDLCFQVLDEFKIDVYKIKNLVNTLLSPQGAQAVQKRIQLGNMQKNYQNALVMDSEDDWDHKQLSFAGIGEIMQQIRMQVAADMRMPMLKLFGTPSQGLNSSDEDSIEVYNSMVESQVRNKLKYDLLRMLEIKCQKLFGMIPDDLVIEFQPLRMLSAEQEQNVKTQKFNRALQAAQAGLIDQLEFREVCNKGNLFDVALDTSDDALTDLADTAVEDDDEGDSAPGANRPDTRKARATVGKGENIRGIGESTKKNSPDFDRRAYEIDGGDLAHSHHAVENPGKVDEGLWAKAQEASKAAFGNVKWPFVTWYYKHHGGKFE
jgi:phage-related protein (TIGR01555 family)